METTLQSLPLSQRTVAQTFFHLLGTPTDCSWHSRSQLSAKKKEVEEMLQSVESPSRTLSQTDLEELESLSHLGISTHFLRGVTSLPHSEASAEPFASHSAKNYSLIESLCQKQKDRLDHEPFVEEHYLAHSLMSGLVAACSNIQPLELSSQVSPSPIPSHPHPVLILEGFDRLHSVPASQPNGAHARATKVNLMKGSSLSSQTSFPCRPRRRTSRATAPSSLMCR